MPLDNQTEKPCLLLVGGGKVGGQLLKRFVPYWHVVLLDKCAETLQQIRQWLNEEQTPADGYRLLEGDATSSLVLAEADIEKADAVVVTTSDDRVNAEVCRIAVERYEKGKIVSLVNKEDAQERFPSDSVDLVHRDRHLATLFENKLQHGSAQSVPYGTGEGQIIEVEIMAGSPVIDRPLEELNAQSWRVAGIHRDKELILPHKDTILEQGDRVLLIGKPDVLAVIAEYIRIGVSEFPRRYGDRLLVPVFSKPRTETFSEEALYIAGNTKIRAVDLLCWNPKAEQNRQQYAERFQAAGPRVHQDSCSEDSLKTLLESTKTGETGCLILPQPSTFSGKQSIGRRHFLKILEEVTCPILVSRGTHPYRRILVPVTDKTESMAAAELAMDMARLLGSGITVVSVLPPVFSVGEAELKSQREALAKTLSLGNLYRMRIENLEKEGNPIREILKISKDFDLLVVSHRRDRRWTAFRPDISHHLIFRAACSVLVVEMGKKKP